MIQELYLATSEGNERETYEHDVRESEIGDDCEERALPNMFGSHRD